MSHIDDSYRDGVAAAQAGDLERAGALLTVAAERAPNDPRVWLWRAACSSNAETATSHLRRVVQIDPNHAVARGALAKLLIARGTALASSDRPAARATLAEACELVPDNASAWHLLREVCDTDTDRLAHSRRAAAALPDSAEMTGCLRDDLVRYAIAASRDRRRDAARDALREASIIAPSDIQVWLALAHVSEPADAVVALRRALELAPGHGAALASLKQALTSDARALAARGDAPQARLRWREVLALDAANADAWVELATVAETADEAVDCLDTALKLELGHAVAAEAIAERTADAGLDAFRRGDGQHATRLLRRSVELAPDNARAWKALAELASTTVDRIECFRRIVGLEPGHTQTVTVLTSLLVQEAAARATAGDRPEALSLLREALRLDPQCAPAWWGLASEAADPGEALKAVARVLAIDPDHQQALALKQRLTAMAAPVPASPGVEAPPPPAPPVGGRTVMVIDDSPTIRKALTIILEKAGHSVIAAADGEQAMASLETSRPDLVFLDITMPKMDGYEVCRQIRKRRELADLPVVMLSGKDGFFDKVRGRVAGATEYITKPFEPPAVLAAITEYCSRVKTK